MFKASGGEFSVKFLIYLSTFFVLLTANFYFFPEFRQLLPVAALVFGGAYIGAFLYVIRYLRRLNAGAIAFMKARGDYALENKSELDRHLRIRTMQTGIVMVLKYGTVAGALALALCMLISEKVAAVQEAGIFKIVVSGLCFVTFTSLILFLARLNRFLAWVLLLLVVVFVVLIVLRIT